MVNNKASIIMVILDKSTLLFILYYSTINKTYVKAINERILFETFRFLY